MMLRIKVAVFLEAMGQHPFSKFVYCNICICDQHITMLQFETGMQVPAVTKIDNWLLTSSQPHRSDQGDQQSQTSSKRVE